MARIAMVVSNRYDPDPRVHKEAASLAASGHDVTVYAFDREHSSLAETELLEGVRVERIRTGVSPYGALLATALGLRRFLGRVRQRLLLSPPDVVHCHDQDTCPAGLWWKLFGASRAGKALPGRGLFVYDAHDLYWTFALMAGHSSIRRRALSQALKVRDMTYARAADLLITVTEAVGGHPGTAEQYRAWGCHPVVIWNAPRAVKDVPPLPTDFTVGYFGNVREPAMFEWLVEAIGLLPASERPHVRVAGGGTEHTKVARMLQSASVELGCSMHVTGPFSLDQLGQLMAQCSVQYALYPRTVSNIDRALPVKLLDAVAHGRPVIATAGTLMADWVEARNWGISVRPGDVRALAEALRELHDSASQPKLAPPPTWEEQAEVLTAAYARLLARH